MPTQTGVQGACYSSARITPMMAADGELSTVDGSATSCDCSDGQTVRGRAQPTQLPLTQPLTRPYRPVWLRCSQLSAVSKRCAPANLTHGGGRDSVGIMTVRVCRHLVRTLSRLRVQWLAWRRSRSSVVSMATLYRVRRLCQHYDSVCGTAVLTRV